MRKEPSKEGFFPFFFPQDYGSNDRQYIIMASNTP